MYGPTIKFFQSGKWGAIKFRKVWLDEFVATHTNDPAKAIERSAPSRRARATGTNRPNSNHGLNPSSWNF